MFDLFCCNLQKYQRKHSKNQGLNKAHKEFQHNEREGRYNRNQGHNDKQQHFSCEYVAKEPKRE